MTPDEKPLSLFEAAERMRPPRLIEAVRRSPQK